MAICEGKNSSQDFLNGSISFSVNRRLYFEGFKYDFYRKCLLPDKKDDYSDITMVGRSEPNKRKTNDEGKVIKHKCNSYFRSYTCDCEKKRKTKINFCHRMICEVCFHKVITRQIKRITGRLGKIERLEGEELKLAHYTFNIIPAAGYNIIDIESLKKYKAKLLRVLNKYGFDGVLIFHPYRKDKDKMRELKDNKFYVRNSPHFHAVARFDSLPNGDEFYIKYKFTYKNISYEKYREGNESYPTPYLQNMDHIRNTIKYLLSHTASLKPRMKFYSYCGKFSTTYYKKINEEKGMVPVICEDCESELYPLDRKKHYGSDSETKSYKIERNVDGIDFNDVYVYDKDTLRVSSENPFAVFTETYDLVLRSDYIEVTSKIKSCDGCLFIALKGNGGSNCMVCKNFSNFYSG